MQKMVAAVAPEQAQEPAQAPAQGPVLVQRMVEALAPGQAQELEWESLGRNMRRHGLVEAEAVEQADCPS